MAANPPSEYPANYLSAKGQSAALGFARLRVGGSGLISTCYGIAGVKATLSSVTGTYSLKYEPNTEVDLRPAFHPNGSMVGSGISYHDVHVGKIEPASGTAELYVSRQVHQGGTGASSSSYNLPVNLPTGAEVSLGLFQAPVTRF